MQRLIRMICVFMARDWLRGARKSSRKKKGGPSGPPNRFGGDEKLVGAELLMAGAAGAAQGLDGGEIGCGVTGLGGCKAISGGGLAGIDDGVEGVPVLPDRRQSLAVANVGAFGKDGGHVGEIVEHDLHGRFRVCTRQ